MGDLEERLAEQREYYRARAPEYDDWWKRTGRYDRGPEFLRMWEDDIATARASLDRFAPSGRVIEFAAGTGNWTAELARHCDHVTAVDSSAETLAINRAKLGDRAHVVDLVQAEIFSFEPTEQYDLVFFSFWLTHVPDGRFEAFWDLVGRCLGPDGRVFIVDNAHPDVTGVVPGGPMIPDGSQVAPQHGSVDLVRGTATRSIYDGRRFEIVKRYWRADDLEERLRPLGWEIRATTTERFFLLANGRRR